MASETILKVEQLSMKFGGLVAIDNLSFDAKRGEITALIGPNGAGKTTVFNCITGFYKPTEGMISLNGKSGATFLLERMPDFVITKKAKVARTFQNIRLFSGMTVLENLLVAQHNKLMLASGFTILGLLGIGGYRKASAQSIDKAKHWLDKIGLTERADDPAGDLPYGAQRRLEIARAMCTEPELLCLDEPAAGLNARESGELNELLLSIRKDTGTSILLIEHDMSVVMQISDHVVVLEYGRKIADAGPKQVRDDPKVIAAYLGVDDEEIDSVAAVVAEVSEGGNGKTIHELDGEPDPAHGPAMSSSMFAGSISDTIGHSGGEMVKVSPLAGNSQRVRTAAVKPAAVTKASAGKAAPQKAASLAAVPKGKPIAAKADIAKPGTKKPAVVTKASAGKAAPKKAATLAALPKGKPIAAKADVAKPGAKKPDAVKAAVKPAAVTKASAGKAAPKKAAALAALPKGKPIAAKADVAKPGAKPEKARASGGAAKTAAKPAPAAKPDDLKLIKGIGPVNNSKLNAHGVTTFAQIAAWKKADVAAAEAYLEFDGRIAREDWIGQAKVLAKGSKAQGRKA